MYNVICYGQYEFNEIIRILACRLCVTINLIIPNMYLYAVTEFTYT